MVAPNNCLTPDQLQDIIDNRLAPEEQQAMTGHLDGCSCCQLALEHLASGDSTLLNFVCESGRAKPPADSAYWGAYRNLQAATAQFEPDKGPKN